MNANSSSKDERAMACRVTDWSRRRRCIWRISGVRGDERLHIYTRRILLSSYSLRKCTVAHTYSFERFFYFLLVFQYSWSGYFTSMCRGLSDIKGVEVTLKERAVMLKEQAAAVKEEMAKLKWQMVPLKEQMLWCVKEELRSFKSKEPQLQQ